MQVAKISTGIRYLAKARLKGSTSRYPWSSPKPEQNFSCPSTFAPVSHAALWDTSACVRTHRICTRGALSRIPWHSFPILRWSGAVQICFPCQSRIRGFRFGSASRSELKELICRLPDLQIDQHLVQNKITYQGVGGCEVSTVEDALGEKFHGYENSVVKRGEAGGPTQSLPLFRR